jgi:uncharacterized protein YdeI (YjbR/CyaY-like superfamily)
MGLCRACSLVRKSGVYRNRETGRRRDHEKRTEGSTDMKGDVPELQFAAREDFRAWLKENAETSDGVWLIFGKTKAVVLLSANDALEEALCFGWIDGQMQSIDSTRYRKYFAKRRVKSVWSDKNKKTVEILRDKGIMTESGENAVKAAIQNGTWDSPKGNSVTDEQVAEFADKLKSTSPAYENFMKMSRSVRLTYTRRHLSFKSEEARQRDFEKIVDRLEQNLKPM